MHAVYDGQTFVGSISKDAEGFAAFDTGGKKLGVFPTRTEAVRSVLAPPPLLAPQIEKAPDFDAENALRRAIDAMAHGAPAIVTSCTVRVSSGSNRTAVPAGMSSRMR